MIHIYMVIRNINFNTKYYQSFNKIFITVSWKKIYIDLKENTDLIWVLENMGLCNVEKIENDKKITKLKDSMSYVPIADKFFCV